MAASDVYCNVVMNLNEKLFTWSFYTLSIYACFYQLMFHNFFKAKTSLSYSLYDIFKLVNLGNVSPPYTLH